MKYSTAFAVAGLIWLFAWGAAFAQSSQVPVGSASAPHGNPQVLASALRPILRQLSSRPFPSRCQRPSPGPAFTLAATSAAPTPRPLSRPPRPAGVAEREPRGCDGRRLRRLQLSGEPEFRPRPGRRLSRQSQLGYFFLPDFRRRAERPAELGCVA